MSDTASIEQASTIFEKVWQQPNGHLFKSEIHGVMAIADRFPRMPLQVVVAPSSGTPHKDQHFYDLGLDQQRKLLELGLIVGSKILNHCTPNQRSMFTLEGFAVKDHAHLVYYAGERGQGIDRYTGGILGDEAVQRTIEVVSFSPVEAEQAEARLAQLDR